MTNAADFMAGLCRSVLREPIDDALERRLLARCIADTLAVAAAGFTEPTVLAASRAIAGDGGRLGWSHSASAGSNGATFINAAASHALDFDDLHMASSAHLSAVLVPALTMRGSGRLDDGFLPAMRAGYVAANAVARRLGPAHYREGWHATGTIGALAATAARARLLCLDESQLRHAFALAAAQSGGLRANFGTAAKPLHAGFAASAGTRSVALATNGISGAEDIFAPGGFFDLYGARSTVDTVPNFEPALDTLSLKLFPCCFASHRLIGAALQARDALGPASPGDDLRFRFVVPAGSLYVLRFDRPQTGSEAIFSAPFPIAAALHDGPPSLHHFTDDAVRRPELRALMDRIEIFDDVDAPGDGSLDAGEIRLEVTRQGDILGRFRQKAIPGSSADHDFSAALKSKFADCFALFEQSYGRAFPATSVVRHVKELEEWLPQ